MLMVYTKADCPGCHQVKRTLHFLRIGFEERRVDEVPMFLDHVRTLGFRSVPVVEMEGVGAVLGTDTRQLEELLHRGNLV
jgi:glutaredoxin-like protein NrdH